MTVYFPQLARRPLAHMRTRNSIIANRKRYIRQRGFVWLLPAKGRNIKNSYVSRFDFLGNLRYLDSSAAGGAIPLAALRNLGKAYLFFTIHSRS
jgi:hypothetical protein